MTNIVMMIDLETLSLEMNATILSAGIVIADLDEADYTPLLETEYFLDLDQERHISPDTLMWHIKHPKALQHNLGNKSAKISLAVFMFELQSMWKTLGVESVWSKGVDFDIGILEDVAKQSDIKVPWTYRQKRCFRTIEAVTKTYLPQHMIDKEVTHTALKDAQDQMQILFTIMALPSF